MSFVDLLSIAGSVLFAIGGGAAIVFCLAKWLGGVWATRILESERASTAREQELLVRRRNVYAKLAVSLRALIGPPSEGQKADQAQFLAAYDESTLWASDDVLNAVGTLLDQLRANFLTPEAHSQIALKATYASCILAMRKDVGFKNTTFAYRLVSL